MLDFQRRSNSAHQFIPSAVRRRLKPRGGRFENVPSSSLDVLDRPVVQDPPALPASPG